MDRKTLSVGLGIFLVIAVAAIITFLFGRNDTFRGTSYDEPYPAASDFSLTRSNGATFRLSDQRGKVTLLFFGYTSCPDVCPTTLAQLRQLGERLPPAARERLRVAMVSVDPQRDTPAQLKQYLGYYQAGYTGLTGELAQIQQLASAVSIPFIPGDASQPNYTVDHSGNLALIGPDGRQRGFIRAPLNVAKLAGQLPVLLRQD